MNFSVNFRSRIAGSDYLQDLVASMAEFTARISGRTRLVRALMGFLFGSGPRGSATASGPKADVSSDNPKGTMGTAE